MEDTMHEQDKDNSPSIEHILRPISYTSWLFGVGWARPLKSPKAVTIIIRIVHLVVCSINVVFGPIAFLIYGNTGTPGQSFYKEFVLFDTFAFMYGMNYVICYMSSYYYVYHGIREYDKWPELMDKMKKLDQKIRREIPFNDQPVIKVVTLAIFAVFVCCPLSLIVHVLYYYCIHPEYIFTHHLLFYYMLSQSLINSFVFDVVVYVLYRRFQTINNLLEQLDALFDASWIAQKITRIRELHNNICVLIIMVNDIHGLHLLLCSANCYTMVMTILLRIYLDYGVDHSFMIIEIIFCILYTTQFGLICWICTVAREESERTGKIIYAFLLNCKHVDGNCIRNEINDFSIQLQQNRVVFTACNFFEMKNAMFSRFVWIVIAYLIMRIQFYKEEVTHMRVTILLESLEK